MKHKNRKRRTARALSAFFAAVTVASLLPMTASARMSGNVVLLEDYYGLNDGAIKMPGLNYRCSGHGDKMVAYYMEDEEGYMPVIPCVTEQVGDKVRYVFAYYCPSCYGTWKGGSKWDGDGMVYDDGSSGGKTLENYMEFVSNNSIAGMASYGYYYPPADDMDNFPDNGTTGNGGNTVAPPEFGVMVGPNGEDWVFLNSGKALPEPVAKQPDESDPIGNWDVTGAWTFYQFYYTGMRKIINKPADADDAAWDTVKDATRIYYMQRQMDGQTLACRIDYSLNYYRYDFSKLSDWRITDLMVEKSTGQVCGYATYVGSQTEVAVPETVNIPLYGNVKVIGVDVENHNLTKVYVNDNVTCIRRLSSVNLEEISGCKNLEYIEKYAFQNDVSLKTIPEMPKLDWIAMGAFEGCISLRDIKLPDNMTFIDFTAFGWYDTVLGNYDIGMDVESWEAFQYLRDLSDNDKILGLTLYAKKGSTTYELLDTLINKNDALTPKLDDNGKPYFKSYGDTVAMMSGEVKNYTSHWNLKSSGDYKGSLASTGKDVDDSTNGRLGEYGEGEPSYSPRKVLEEGALVASLLTFFGITSGVSKYKKKKETMDEHPHDPEDDYWGISEVFDDLEDADKTKLYFDILDAVSDKLDKFGKGGKIGKELIEEGKNIQKMLDIYAETGDWALAYDRVRTANQTSGEFIGMATELVPQLGTWDLVTGIIFGNSKAADAISFGANAEHTFDIIRDMGNAYYNERILKTYDKDKMITADVIDRAHEGAYGENWENIAYTIDLTEPGAMQDVWNGIFGEDGMGFEEFMNGICQTATETTTDNSLVSGYLLELFNNKVEQFYANR